MIFSEKETEVETQKGILWLCHFGIDRGQKIERAQQHKKTPYTHRRLFIDSQIAFSIIFSFWNIIFHFILFFFYSRQQGCSSAPRAHWPLCSLSPLCVSPDASSLTSQYVAIALWRWIDNYSNAKQTHPFSCLRFLFYFIYSFCYSFLLFYFVNYQFLALAYYFLIDFFQFPDMSSTAGETTIRSNIFSVPTHVTVQPEYTRWNYPVATIFIGPTNPKGQHPAVSSAAMCQIYVFKWTFVSLPAGAFHIFSFSFSGRPRQDCQPLHG